MDIDIRKVLIIFTLFISEIFRTKHVDPWERIIIRGYLFLCKWISSSLGIDKKANHNRGNGEHNKDDLNDVLTSLHKVNHEKLFGSSKWDFPNNNFTTIIIHFKFYFIV